MTTTSEAPAHTYRPTPRIEVLGDGFFDRVDAAKFPKQILRYRNQRWASRVGLDRLSDGEWRRHFAGFEPLADNLRSPLALRYHGHQFRSYNPSLGDGRGFLFAQLEDCADGRLLDLGTKGSGTTPWSRGGDGRLTLKGGVREVLATAQLEALGVYTSKSFSLFETGEELYRGDEPSPTRSSVLVRLSHSHIRFGSFQRHAAARDAQKVQALLDYSVENYMPELAASSGAERVRGFLENVCAWSARLVASWMAAGFVHGVLNTDNMNITGESFDYGPYRFLPTLDPDFTAAYFDHSGLYAFGRQPETVAWNLERLAETLTLVCEVEPLKAALSTFRGAFEGAFRAATLARLGVLPRDAETDQHLVDVLYGYLTKNEVGYDQFFFDWYGGVASRERAAAGPAADLYAGDSFDRVMRMLADYEPAGPQRLESPYFQCPRPCSMLIDEIESIWDAIAERDDWSLFSAKLSEVETMRRALEGSPAAES